MAVRALGGGKSETGRKVKQAAFELQPSQRVQLGAQLWFSRRCKDGE
jgi:hypothetical protein